MVLLPDVRSCVARTVSVTLPAGAVRAPTSTVRGAAAVRVGTVAGSWSAKVIDAAPSVSRARAATLTVTFKLAVAVACAYAEDDMRRTAAAVERPTFTSVFRIDVAPFANTFRLGGSG